MPSPPSTQFSVECRLIVLSAPAMLASSHWSYSRLFLAFVDGPVQ